MPSDQDSLLPTVEPTVLPTATTLTIPLQTSRSAFAAIYSRFYFTLVILLFLSLWATSWPKPLRSLYTNLLSFAYFSIWIPQILRNVARNCRKALTWEYVVGSSVLRATPVLYWYCVEGNVLAVDTSRRAALFLGGWLALQVAILAAQRILGPRWAVPEKWCPEAYDYHPILVQESATEDDDDAGADIEAQHAQRTSLLSAKRPARAGVPVSHLASASEVKDDAVSPASKPRRVFDCAICMNEIDVPVVPSSSPPPPSATPPEQRRTSTELKSATSAPALRPSAPTQTTTNHQTPPILARIRAFLHDRLGLRLTADLGLDMGALGLGRADYMVTPCRHVFHAECLEGWMGLRLVCPVCREALPPL
jgi:transmembrane E3 ubiquitin-protein ligase